MNTNNHKPPVNGGMFGARSRRPTLFPVDQQFDRLLENLPCGEVDDVNGLRSWTRLLLREVSAWQVGRAQRIYQDRVCGKGRVHA